MTEDSDQKISLKHLRFSIYLPSLLMSIGQGIYLLVIPLFSIHLGATVAGAGTIFAIKGIGTLISDVPAGFAISRFGEKRLMLASFVLIAISFLTASQAQTLLLLGIATFIFGVGTGILMLTRLHYVTESVFFHQRGRALSMVGGVHRVGVFIGPVLGGLSIKYLGYEITLLISTVLAVIVFGIVFFVLPKRGKHESNPPSQQILKQVPQIFIKHRKIFITAGFATITLVLIRAGRQLLLPLWGESIGLDSAEIGFIYGISSAIDMSLFVVAGIIMDRFGRKWTAVPCLFLISISLILLPWSNSFASFMLVAFLSGLGNGLGSGIVQTLGADFSPQVGRGEFLGVWRLIGDIGGAVGPIIIGLLGKLFVLGTASIATGGIGLVGTVIMLFFVRETRVKPQRAESVTKTV